jgi:hypothetical protein
MNTHTHVRTYVDIHTAILYNYTVYESGGMYMHVCKHVQRMNQEVMFIQTGLVLVPAHLVRMCTVLHCVCVYVLYIPLSPRTWLIGGLIVASHISLLLLPRNCTPVQIIPPRAILHR